MTRMNRMSLLLATGASALLLGACTTADQPMPLVFGRTQSIGIGVQGSAADQGASITLGFNDRNIAVVPTTTMAGDKIRSIATDKDNLPFEDALVGSRSVRSQCQGDVSGCEPRHLLLDRDGGPPSGGGFQRQIGRFRPGESGRAAGGSGPRAESGSHAEYDAQPAPALGRAAGGRPGAFHSAPWRTDGHRIRADSRL